MPLSPVELGELDEGEDGRAESDVPGRRREEGSFGVARGRRGRGPRDDRGAWQHGEPGSQGQGRGGEGPERESRLDDLR